MFVDRGSALAGLARQSDRGPTWAEREAGAMKQLLPRQRARKTEDDDGRAQLTAPPVAHHPGTACSQRQVPTRNGDDDNGTADPADNIETATHAADDEQAMRAHTRR